MELLVIFRVSMHAWFQFVFSSFLPQRFAGSASISYIFDICGGRHAIAKADPGFFQQSDDWQRCYRDMRLRHAT